MAAVSGLLAGALWLASAEVASAAPTFTNVTGWHQYYAPAIGDVAADWSSPLVGKANTNLVDVVYLANSPSGACATAPAQNYLPGACYGQCVDYTARWFSLFVYKNRPVAQSEIWGNGGDPICKCAAGQDGCATNSALYEVHWPGDAYVPMTGDVLSFTYTHAALVTNVYSDASGTHLGVAQQNVSSVNTLPWHGTQFDSEACIIHAKRLVCEDEPALKNPPPMGPTAALVFACGDQRRTTDTGDWSAQSYKAECGIGEALTGLSVRQQFESAHAALCGLTDSSLLHGASDCHALDISHANAEPAGAADWDVGYVKGLCDGDEYVAGVSQTADLQVHDVLCCKGTGLTHQACATKVFASGDAREAGTSGDWDSGKFKGECGPGRFVTGVSTYANGTRKLHAIECCAGVAPPPPDPTTSAATTSQTTGAGGGAPAGGGAGGGATGNPDSGPLHGGCACRAAPGGDGGSSRVALAGLLVALLARRRRRRA